MSEWIECGGYNPAGDDMVDVRFRNGSEACFLVASGWDWRQTGSIGDIVAYRLSAPPTPAEDRSNPKDAVGSRKLPMSAIPAQPLAEIGLAMLEGARKYGRHNFRAAGVRASVYYDAAMRHMMQWWEGQDTDPDSGGPHLAHALACLVVLRDAQINGMCTDDRPPPVKDPEWMKRLNERAGDICDKYPDAKAPVTRVFEPIDGHKDKMAMLSAERARLVSPDADCIHGSPLHTYCSYCGC